jgi:hypothetical protein
MAGEEKAERTAEDIAEILREALTNMESRTGVTAHEWPFPQDQESQEKWGFMMYVQTEEPRQRFSISVQEFYAFGDGTSYF